MTVVDRVQYNLLVNPYAGTNRRRCEPIEEWVRRAEIACYACGSRAIGGITESLGWLCLSCLKQHQEETQA
jgi:hypothetical protein